MKKILVVLCAFLLFTGCSCSLNDRKPEDAIDTFFEKYRSKDDNIITQLKDTIKNEDLTDNQKEKYQKLMEKQYDQLAYVVKDVTENGNTANATVEITVLNYKSAITEAESKLESSPEEFNDDNGKLSEEKYMDYKIEKMDAANTTTTYTIDLSLTKENGMWKVNKLSSDDISKIHGLY